MKIIILLQILLIQNFKILNNKIKMINNNKVYKIKEIKIKENNN